MSAHDDIPHYRAQLFLPAELAETAIEVALQENPDIINSPDMAVPPAGGVLPAQGSGPPRIGLFVRKMWRPGRTLRSKYASISFEFVNSLPADIRITFAKDGSWSYIGTDCKDTRLVPANQATMNFGWFNDKTPELEFSRTTLHEFGHEIGCIHKHSQPKAKIQWNKPVVLAFYKRQGWNAQKVESNIFHYNEGDVTSSAFDSLSIMEYTIPKEFTTNYFEVGYNNFLSHSDIEFIGRMYPKQTPIRPQPM
ncbi:hypothetical protein EV127DRAFT_485962 [Xylaria flabelliformis]|nr:hypothetical protein EV127DRAFT_485962 [Xylaria flabelliformis]